MSELWQTNEQSRWLSEEKDYWNLVRPSNYELEKEIENIDVDSVKDMTEEKFYDFLYNKYFVWKYTAKNRLATTRKHLSYYKDNLEELAPIHRDLFSFDTDDIKQGLEIAERIKGLGCAGASGLLAVLFPEKFGTVDQFVVS